MEFDVREYFHRNFTSTKLIVELKSAVEAENIDINKVAVDLQHLKNGRSAGHDKLIAEIKKI